MLIAAAVAVPIVVVGFVGLTPGDEIWAHLVSTVLPLYISTTLQLMVGVGIVTALFGIRRSGTSPIAPSPTSGGTNTSGTR